MFALYLEHISCTRQVSWLTDQHSTSPSHILWVMQWLSKLTPCIQWPVRSGFSPDSLFRVRNIVTLHLILQYSITQFKNTKLLFFCQFWLCIFLPFRVSPLISGKLTEIPFFPNYKYQPLFLYFIIYKISLSGIGPSTPAGDFPKNLFSVVYPGSVLQWQHRTGFWPVSIKYSISLFQKPWQLSVFISLS